MEYVKPIPVPLKSNKTFGGEVRVQEIIANDPAVLGLDGDIQLMNKEFHLPGGGILDILLGDDSNQIRYEVEIQLGDIDESHIIRIIEYWDIMRKLYPKEKHIAVIIAERITTRFFNVIGLFNQAIPIIAIQFSGLEVGGKFTLVFTKVLDLVPQRDQTDLEYQPADRLFWESRTSSSTLKAVDRLVLIAKEFDPKIELKYNKGYIGISIGGVSRNFLVFSPRKKILKFAIQLSSTAENHKLCEDAGFEVEYDPEYSKYRFVLRLEDIEKHEAFFRDFIRRSYEEGV
jgi:hypothetical protein